MNASSLPVGKPYFSAAGQALGLQIYTLGAAADADLSSALRHVAAIGYREIEFIGYHGHSAAALRRELSRSGLRCPSWKFAPRAWAPGMSSFEADLDRLLEDAATLGVSYLVCLMFCIPDRFWPLPATGAEFVAAVERAARSFTADDWKRNADFLNQKGVFVKRAGFQFAVHHTNLEFRPLDDGNGYDLLLANTDPELVKFEMDVGAVASAGHDPAAYLRRHPNRFRLMHLKDLKKAVQPNTASMQAQWTEVGAGDVDWAAVIAAARDAGVEHYYVEQEPPFLRPPIEAARISYQYLQRLTV